MFYEGREKVIKEEIKEYLTPLALAVWIMDEGGKGSAGLKLATNGFRKEGVERLRDILRDKYELETRVHKGNKEKDQYVIYVQKGSMEKLAKIVKGKILESMRYKLNGYL